MYGNKCPLLAHMVKHKHCHDNCELYSHNQTEHDVTIIYMFIFFFPNLTYVE